MANPNLNTIKPVDPASLAILGQKISDHPSYKHRTPTRAIFGVLFIAAAFMMAFLILGQGWSHWWWLLIPALAFFAYMCFEPIQILGLSVYENGIVIFKDTEPKPKIRTWTQLEFGETNWGQFYEFNFRDRETGEYLGLFNTSEMECQKRKLRKVLREQPIEPLIQFWNEILERGQTVDYSQVTLQSDGVFFKKVEQVLPYFEFNSWTANDDWQAVYRTASGQVFETKLYTYDIPYVDSLFEFAERRTNG